MTTLYRERRTSAAIVIHENATRVARRWSVRWLLAAAGATATWLVLANPAFLPVVALTAFAAVNSTYAWYRLAKYRAKPSTQAS